MSRRFVGIFVLLAIISAGVGYGWAYAEQQHQENIERDLEEADCPRYAAIDHIFREDDEKTRLCDELRSKLK